MISLTYTAGARHGRVFVPDGTVPGAELANQARMAFWDEEDASRAKRLHTALDAPVVGLDAHQGLESTEEWHLFVRSPDGPIFACVIVSEDEVEAMLGRAPFVQETFSFQVAGSKRITRANLVAAFETWMQRNFPDLALPVVLLEQWSDGAAIGRVLRHVIASPQHYVSSALGFVALNQRFAVKPIARGVYLGVGSIRAGETHVLHGAAMLAVPLSVGQKLS